MQAPVLQVTQNPSSLYFSNSAGCRIIYDTLEKVFACLIAPVAQRTEQRFPKPCVARSSRARGT